MGYHQIQNFFFFPSPIAYRLLPIISFLVGFVPITVAGQRWSRTTFPSRLAYVKKFFAPSFKKSFQPISKNALN